MLMLDKEDNLMGYVFLYPKRYIVLDDPRQYTLFRI